MAFCGASIGVSLGNIALMNMSHIPDAIMNIKQIYKLLKVNYLFILIILK